MIYEFPRAEVKSHHWVIFVLLFMKPIQSSIQRASVSSWWRAGTPTVMSHFSVENEKPTMSARWLLMVEHWEKDEMGWRERKYKEILTETECTKHMGGKSVRWSCIRNCSCEVLQKLQSIRMRENNPVYKTTLHLPPHRAYFRDWMARCRRGGARSLKGKRAL